MSPWEMSPWDGLEGAPVHRYTSMQRLQECVRSHSSAFKNSLTDKQYLVFMGVKKVDFEKMDEDKQRAKIGLDTRLSHYADINLLVIKMMPSKEHELAHLTLANRFIFKLGRMGLPEECVGPVGGTKYELPDSSKEGDTAFCPIQFRQQKGDWPTIVFESGFSKSLPRLRHDAEWWITKSQGDVKIVIVISVRPAEKWLAMEKWCPGTPNRRATRSNPNANNPVPMKVQELNIIQNPTPQQGATARSIATSQQISTVQPGTPSPYDICGGPLTLEFHKVFLRNPVPPEGDIVFDITDLARFASAVWMYLE